MYMYQDAGDSTWRIGCMRLIKFSKSVHRNLSYHFTAACDKGANVRPYMLSDITYHDKWPITKRMKGIWQKEVDIRA